MAFEGAPHGLLLYAPPEPGVGPLARTVPALLIAGILPGWALARLLRVDGYWLTLACAVLFSALLAVLLALPGLAGGRDFDGSGRVLGLVLWGVALVALLRGLRRTPAPGPGGADAPTFERPWSALAVLALAGLVAALYAQNHGLAWRSDGWFHAAVTAHLADTGLPLGDPYFAGQALHYPWFWHALVGTTAAIGGRLDVSIFDAMAGWSALAALATGAALVALAQAWGRRAGFDAAARDRAGAFAVVAAVVLVNPFGWMLWLGRGLLGADGGLAVLTRPFGVGAAETLGALSLSTPHVSLASTLDKYVTPTAFGLAQAAFLVAAAFLVGARRPRFVLGGLAVAIGLLVHTILLPVFLVGLVSASLARVVVSQRGPAIARGAGVALAAILLGVAVTWPYLQQAIARGTDGLRLGGHLDMLIALVVLGGVVAALAWGEARRPGRRPSLRVASAGWIALTTVLVFLALAFTLTQRNETKFLNFALLAMAVPAGVALARWSPARSLALCLVALPTTLVAIAGFALDPGHETIGRRTLPPELAAAYDAVARETTPRDLLLEPQPAQAHDPDRDLLVHGPRALVWGGEGYARNWGYDAADLALRRRAALELAAGVVTEATTADLRRRAEAAGGRVFAVRRDPAAPPLGGPWARVFGNGALALEELDGSPPPPPKPRSRYARPGEPPAGRAGTVRIGVPAEARR